MNLFTQYVFLFYYTVNIFWFFGITDGYIMPICSENGGICMDKTADGECTNQLNLKITNMSDLFYFVTITMEVTKRWMYDQVFTICHFFYKEPEEPPKQISYFDGMWEFLGFHEEPKQKEIEYTPCNVFIFGLILIFYFGYVLMATKCFAIRKSSQTSTEQKPSRNFFPFLAKENGLAEEEEEVESEDESTIVFQPKCAECKEHSNISLYSTAEDEEP